nr:YebC/PmpR family DNA-binding transcriptional regulator [bacterium]
AEDIKEEGDTVEVTCAIEDFPGLQEAFDKAGMKYEEAQLTFVPQTTVKLDGKQAETMLKLIEQLEELDDVQDVYGNFDISDEEMERLS